MSALASTLRWDLVVQSRSFVYPATVFSTLVICGFVMLLPLAQIPASLAAFFVFMDPATIGLSFVGAIVLMEKTQGTLQAITVTPLRPSVYVCSKVISLTLPAFAAGAVVAWLVADHGFRPLAMLTAIGLSSLVAVLVGFRCVARAPSMNRLMITLLWVSTLGYLPLLAHFELVPPALGWVLAAVPSYAMLVVLEAAFVDPGAAGEPGLEVVGAYLYLILWGVLGWFWSVRAYRRDITTEGR